MDTINLPEPPFDRKRKQPMEDFDSRTSSELVSDDYELLLKEVICEEADLFYIDCYLRELFRGKKR